MDGEFGEAFGIGGGNSVRGCLINLFAEEKRGRRSCLNPHTEEKPEGGREALFKQASTQMLGAVECGRKAETHEN